MIRVAIADDHPRLREALAFILSHSPGISIVAQCANGEEAVKAVEKHSPDVILLDINMAPMNGCSRGKHLKKKRRW